MKQMGLRFQDEVEGRKEGHLSRTMKIFRISETLVSDKIFKNQGQVEVAHGNQGNFFPDWVAGLEEDYWQPGHHVFFFFNSLLN